MNFKKRIQEAVVRFSAEIQLIINDFTIEQLTELVGEPPDVVVAMTKDVQTKQAKATKALSRDAKKAVKKAVKDTKKAVRKVTKKHKRDVKLSKSKRRHDANKAYRLRQRILEGKKISDDDSNWLVKYEKQVAAPLSVKRA